MLTLLPTNLENNEVLSGYQLGWVVEWTNQWFKDHLYPHPQGCDMAGGPVCCLYTSLSSVFFDVH